MTQTTWSFPAQQHDEHDDQRPARRRPRDPWWRLWVVALLATIPIGHFGPRVLGSGSRCYGIGWGCDLEPLIDAALVIIAYVATLAVGFVTSLLVRRRHPWITPTTVVLAVVIAGVVWVQQLPDYPTRPQPVSLAVAELDAALDLAPHDGGDLAHAVAELKRLAPEPCEDAIGRRTGGWRVNWRGETDVADSNPADLEAFAEQLRDRGYTARRKLLPGDVDGIRAERDGVEIFISVRDYASLFEISATSDCMLPPRA